MLLYIEFLCVLLIMISSMQFRGTYCVAAGLCLSLALLALLFFATRRSIHTSNQEAVVLLMLAVTKTCYNNLLVIITVNKLEYLKPEMQSCLLHIILSICQLHISLTD